MVQALFCSLPGAEPLSPELTFCVYTNFMAMPGQPPKLRDLEGGARETSGLSQLSCARACSVLLSLPDNVTLECSSSRCDDPSHTAIGTPEL